MRCRVVRLGGIWGCAPIPFFWILNLSSEFEGTVWFGTSICFRRWPIVFLGVIFVGCLRTHLRRRRLCCLNTQWHCIRKEYGHLVRECLLWGERRPGLRNFVSVRCLVVGLCLESRWCVSWRIGGTHFGQRVISRMPWTILRRRIMNFEPIFFRIYFKNYFLCWSSCLCVSFGRSAKCRDFELCLCCYLAVIWARNHFKFEGILQRIWLRICTRWIELHRRCWGRWIDHLLKWDLSNY